MANLTVRAPDDLLDALTAEADEAGITRAEHVRACLRDRHAHTEHIDALETQLAECETECERLRREKRLILERREEHTDLVRAEQQQASLAEKRSKASAGTRLRWWLFGMPADDD